MLRSWFPWKFIVRRLARSHGFIDPIAVLSRLHGFAQPSEVAEPLELLRAGVVFHARGLMNTRAIQHNLDWVWPYWVERQFDPKDESFIPRAFSITHVNLTHRNWTAVGLPDHDELPIVDPRGLVTPLWDCWSLDAWIISESEELIPSRLREADQELRLGNPLEVVTSSRSPSFTLTSSVRVVPGSPPRCEIAFHATAAKRAWLVLSLRPYNPEGVSFIHRVKLADDRLSWRINDEDSIRFNAAPERHFVSHYKLGDVFYLLHHADAEGGVHRDTTECDIGLATAAVMYRVPENGERAVTAVLDLPQRKESGKPLKHQRTADDWDSVLAGTARLVVPDSRLQFLYDAAVRTLVLHSPGDVYPGPYTYKRFWFRDAAFILQALLALCLPKRVLRVLETFPRRQTAGGYYLSQEGEWDSNGEALWSIERFCTFTNSAPDPAWRSSVLKGADWIIRKRIKTGDTPHSGLFPAGFSAEHLGPNDYYYWDDFWGVAGLKSAARLASLFGDPQAELRLKGEADRFMAAVERSISSVSAHPNGGAIPASPYRRMDSGAIGSLAGDYPLLLFAPGDSRVLRTVDFLLERSSEQGAFFQDMIHSGINAYLTLHIAQVLLRAGDTRFKQLVDVVRDFASPTGQWPEAIHPRTRGGCMGDGQHAWAAAELVLMLRNMFVREDDGSLIIGSGLTDEWLSAGSEVSFGPTLTEFGPVTVRAMRTAEGVSVSWEVVQHREPRSVVAALPGTERRTLSGRSGSVIIGA